MTYLVIDTETSGLFDFKKPADAPGQPRLASLAAIFVDADGTVSRRENRYVQPDGWEMPAEASAINGLTTEFLRDNGDHILEVLDFYSQALSTGLIVVAYNAQYDLKVMRGELRRYGLPDMFETTKNICVMRPMVDVCKIPRGRGGGFKFPKLTEALAHFGHTLDGAHQAHNDAEGARIVFEELRTLELLPTAAVHYAKEPTGDKAGGSLLRKATAASKGGKPKGLKPRGFA